MRAMPQQLTRRTTPSSCWTLHGNAIGDDGAVALADAIKALLMMLGFLWNMTGILVTTDEHGLATDMLAHEKGSAPSSQSRTCCVARNVSHRMAKRWNIRSDGVSRRAPWHRVCDADHMQAVSRETHSSVTGIHRELTCHRFCDGLSCRGTVGEGEGRWTIGVASS